MKNRFIEIHTHMFNGNYVPLEEFIYHRILGRILLLRPIAISLGMLTKLIIGVKSLTYKDAQSILNYLQELNNPKLTENEIAQAAADFFCDIIFHEIKQQPLIQDNKQVTLEDLLDTPILFALTQFIKADSVIENKADGAKEYKDFEQDLLMSFNKSTSKINNKKIATATNRTIDKVLTTIYKYFSDATPSTIKFLVKMVLKDTELCDCLVNKNYDSSNLPSLSIHLTMDIEAAYQSIRPDYFVIGPTYEFETQQISRAAKLARSQKGKLLGFVAFHPERGLKGLERCKEAIREGYAGIKIYPPLNYRPDGKPMRKSRKRQRVKNYEKEMNALYAYCQNDDIPILTHCMPNSFEPWKNTGALSNPKYWKYVLEDYKMLRLCFGHGGGGDCIYNDYYETGKMNITTLGWYSDNWDIFPDDWESLCKVGNYAKMIVHLCRQFKNVYTDLSYLHRIVNDGNEDHKMTKVFFKNFNNELTKQKTNANYSFSTKVMYGSDWHMREIIGKTNQYMEKFNSFFENGSQEVNMLKDLFFFKNAIQYLNVENYLKSGHAHQALDPDGVEYLEQLLIS